MEDSKNSEKSSDDRISFRDSDIVDYVSSRSDRRHLATRAMLHKYMWLMQETKKYAPFDFSSKEALAIYEGSEASSLGIEVDPDEIPFYYTKILAKLRRTGRHLELGVDYAALETKLRELAPVQVCALIDSLEQLHKKLNSQVLSDSRVEDKFIEEFRIVGLIKEA